MDDMLFPNTGVKRRLPLWILGDQGRSKSETVNLKNTINDGKGCENDEERVEKCSKRAKSNSRKKGNDCDSVRLKEPSSTVLVKCRERKQTRREVITHDTEISHDDDTNKDVARKKRKRRQKTKACFENETDKDDEGCQQNEDAEDLTVEDLMSIAKEFVQEDNDAQVVVSSKGKDMAESRSQDIAQSGSSLNVTDPNRALFESQGTSSSTMTENLTSDAGFKPTMSGNPAQDMLDLFLGPLLKKTQEQEKENRPSIEELSFTREVKKQQSSVDLGGEPIVVVKKKSSLKDKVAMFLD